MEKKFSNQAVSELLKAVAAAYEIKGDNHFRVSAYRQAATAVEHLTSEIIDLWEEGRLATIPGIGPSIAQHLDDFFRHGKSRHFEEVLAGIPPAVFQLIKIAGIGPKTAYRLCQGLGIWQKRDAVEKIVEAARKGKIRALAGFGTQSEKKLLAAISMTQLKKKEKQRMLLALADNLAQELLDYLRAGEMILTVETLGSLRRRCATVGDIDIAVKTKHYRRAMEYFLAYPRIGRIINRGEKKTSVVLKNGVQVDIRFQRPPQWGSMLQYFTGSKQHNIRLRELGRQKGYSLSEYGIRRLKDKKLFFTANEKIFYKFLGLDYIPPELREDQGEIEAAHNHQLPHLVRLRDIRGDLHSHSNFNIETSHDLGKDSFQVMLEAAAQRGYEYLGFSEHNPAQKGHTEERIIALLKEKAKNIDHLNRQLHKKLHIIGLNSLEIDIRPDGSLALPRPALELLDYAIISIHSQFRLPKDKMTARLLRAMANPKVRIVGHPTGRKFYQRDSFDLDWDKIFTACRERNIALEINSWPERLDLPDLLVREAVKAGVMLVINTDAHAVEHLNFMPYGVDVARRGWAEARNILNTKSWAELKRFWRLKSRF